MDVRQALRYGATALAGHSCAGADAVRDTELLLACALNGTKELLAIAPERRLSVVARARFQWLVARRAAHVPMAHLTGWAWFFGRRFRVTRATLVPRPATETIVEAALEAAEKRTVFIDVGTGSGCVAVTCALEKPDARVYATDLSRRALRTARRNAVLHGIADRVAFLRDDLIDHTRAMVGPQETVVVIANLPYLPDRMRTELAPDVLDHEPASALFGGTDGLGPSRRLIDQIAAWPERPRTAIFFELLTDQVGPFSAYASNKIPGLSAEPVLNAASTPIGVRLTVR